MENFNHIDLLQARLADKQRINSRYSLRQFAKSLEIDPGAISNIMNGKRSLSFSMGKKILEKLQLDPALEKKFLDSIVIEQNSRDLKRLSKEITNYNGEVNFNEIEQEHYKIIGSWIHYAILELTYVKGFQSDPKWIASELGINTNQAKEAVERLIRLNFLNENSDGELSKSQDFITTENKTKTGHALKKLQKEILEKAIESVDRVDISKRCNASMTMTVDPDKIELARTLITNFSETLCEVLNDGEDNKVYNLSVALYPLQQGDKNEN